TYRGIAEASTVGPDGAWHEFILGLLDSGEVLLDDISVLESPGTASQFQLLLNGSFESDNVGGPASGWRIIGNHRHSEVIVDADDPTNQVLRLVATGPTEHMHNHAETTLAAGRTIQNGREYEISFRAKWMSGTNLLNTRLYFNRLARTTPIARGADFGTPGGQNSVYESNLGPTYRGFIHGPAVPSPGQPVVVKTFADDPDGVASMRLWYAVNGGTWQSVAMEQGSDGLYAGVIPGHVAKTIVQFYVEGTDALGATSTFPRAGRDSRALFKVDGGEASNTGINNLRIILTPADANYMHATINLMSNDEIGATLIYNEHEIFYDAGVQLSGSERARPVTARVSFSVHFNADQLFRGVHEGMKLDRSDSTGFGQRELLLHTAASHAGGLPSEYNDLVNIITPQAAHTGGAEMQMARYSDLFLDSQFENGSDGQLFEYELVYYPTQANAQGNKLPQPDNVVGTGITDLGDSAEDYRWIFLNKNNRSADDYHRIIEWAKIMGLSGAAFNNQIGDVMDVDQYLRAMAFASSSGFGDNYSAGAQHNAQFYVRPEDNRVLYFLHDLDAFFSSTAPIVASGDLQKLLNAAPGNRHVYYGHVHDIVTYTYTTSYMQYWTNHYRSLLPNQNWSAWLADIGLRASNVRAQINSAIPPIAFAITTNGGADFTVNEPVATLSGDGWVNVREIYIAGREQPLDVQWVDDNSWTTTVPLVFGANALTLEAVDYRGNLVASDTITITSTSTGTDRYPLRIVELMYNPPGSTDDNEYFELLNTGTSTIDLTGVKLTEFSAGGYTFNSGTLGPRERIVVVKDHAAFSAAYPGITNIAPGVFDGTLANEGELIALLGPLGELVQHFTYGDSNISGWPSLPDGDGHSLEYIGPFNMDSADPAGVAGDPYDNSASWRASLLVGGSPGAGGELEPIAGDYDVNRVVDQDDYVKWKSQYGMIIAPFTESDGNGDGKVDAADYVIWRKNLGAVALSAALPTSDALQEDFPESAPPAVPSARADKDSVALAFAAWSAYGTDTEWSPLLSKAYTTPKNATPATSSDDLLLLVGVARSEYDLHERFAAAARVDKESAAVEVLADTKSPGTASSMPGSVSGVRCHAPSSTDQRPLTVNGMHGLTTPGGIR
ncbi:MAG TPA: lamin tail domain-containing protein, partial [Lacipirellulaceae bacterium]